MKVGISFKIVKEDINELESLIKERKNNRIVVKLVVLR